MNGEERCNHCCQHRYKYFVVISTNITAFTGNEITVNAYGSYRARFKRAAANWSGGRANQLSHLSEVCDTDTSYQVNGLGNDNVTCITVAQCCFRSSCLPPATGININGAK